MEQATSREGLMAALLTVARWEESNGRGLDSPFRHLAIDRSAPPGVQVAWERLHSGTFRDLLGTAIGSDDVLKELVRFRDQLDDRDMMILRERVVSDTPVTLAVLGERLDLTAERVRQVEKSLRERLARETGPGGFFEMPVRVIIHNAHPATPLSAMIDRYPVFGALDPHLDVPVWKVLDAASPDVEIRDGWVAVPSFAQARGTTTSELRRHETSPGVIPLAQAMQALASGRAHADVVAWFAVCGFGVVNEHVIDRSGTLDTLIERVLTANVRPLDVDGIYEQLALLGVRRSRASMSATLSRSPMFESLGKGMWGLADAPVPS